MTERPQEPLTFQNVPTGVTGIPRLPEWDAVVTVELAELEGSPLREFTLEAPADGPLRAGADADVPAEALARIEAALDAELDRPWEGRAVRQDEGRRWAAGANAVPAGEAVDLPEPLPAESLEVVRTPDGDRVVQADGEPLEEAEAERFAAALAELEQRGAARFESFVARADRGQGGGWQVRVDPL
jgi:hypothetical protein